MAHQDTDHSRSLLDERCARHQFEAAIDRCRQCGHPFCGECLVYSFGEKQPPFCVPCALSAAGVRSNAARPAAMPKKELRRRQKAEARVAEEAEARAANVETRIDWSLPIDGSGSGSGSESAEGPTFPTFDDVPDERPRPQAPKPPPPRGKTRGGLLGRKKNKAVPF
jgi:hypothetical protein